LNIDARGAPGLRARKAADLKLRLVAWLTDALRERTFDEIGVEQMCDATMISKVTFFRYFPTKDALLAYHNGVWTYRLKAECLLGGLEGVPALRLLFERMGESVDANVNLFSYFFNLERHLLRGGSRPELSAAERLAIHPDGSTLDLEITPSFGEFINRHVQAARAAGEIRTDVPTESQTLLVGAVLNGSGLVGARIDPEHPGAAFATAFETLLILLRP